MSDEAKVRLYEFAVYYAPPQDEEDADEPQMIVEPDTILSGSKKAVQLKAARQIPESFDDKLEDVYIVIRPFG